MPRNKLSDLNNHLFEIIETIKDPDIKGKDLEDQLKRAKVVNEVASNIIENAKVVVLASKLITNSRPDDENRKLLKNTIGE